METMRQSWTDDRLDEFGRRIDERFDRVDKEIKDVRREIKDVREEIKDVRQEIKDVCGGTNAALQALQLTIIRTGGALFVALLGLIVVGQA